MNERPIEPGHDATVETLSQEVPPPMPDGGEESSPVQEPPVDSPPDDKPKPPPVYEDPRKAIADGFRKSRMDQMHGQTEDFNDARLVDPNELLEKSEVSGAVAEAPRPARVKVKIDGVEKEVAVEDLVRTYQKDQTAEVRLQEATRLLNEAKNAAATGASPTKADHESDSGTESAPPTRTPTAPPTDLADATDEELTELAESLMTGSTAEAVTSLKKVLKRPQAADISTQVERTIALREENQQSAKALEKFGEKYGALQSDGVLSAAVVEVIRGELLKDLKQANVPQAFIDQFHLAEPQGMNTLKEVHKVMRAAGMPGARKTDEILSVVERNPTFLKLIGPNAQPSPQIAVDRGERKQGVQTQPALRNAPPPSSQSAPPRPQDRAQAQSRAVEQMRKMRGQSAYV